MEFNNHAFIDGANLYRGIADLGWKLDYARFRVWLWEKYSVTQAHIFLGFIPQYSDLYADLKDAGFDLIFKDVTYDDEGRVKGNCDADLVLYAVCGAYEAQFDQAILVSSDGDYAGLAKFLHKNLQLFVILSPRRKCSKLLKRLNVPITYFDDVRSMVQVQNKKAPDADETA